MAIYITTPKTTFDGNVTQKRLGNYVPKETTLVADTAANILEADATATLGRKVTINNPSETESVKLAYGRTVTATNFSFEMEPESSIVDMDYSGQSISAISTGTPTIIVDAAKWEEV